MRNAKIMHYDKAQNKAKGNSKTVWKIAREITGYGKKTGNGSIGDIQGCNST
jgi:hypothetical protein